MINDAIEYDLEQSAWEIWLTLYPHFTSENFIPFEEFKNEQITKVRYKERKSYKEIEEEMDKLIKKLKERE